MTAYDEEADRARENPADVFDKANRIHAKEREEFIASLTAKGDRAALEAPMLARRYRDLAAAAQKTDGPPSEDELAEEVLIDLAMAERLVERTEHTAGHAGSGVAQDATGDAPVTQPSE